MAVPGREDLCHVADLAVTCRPHVPGQRLLEEPLVVVEILSPSTERRDRKVKLPDYRSIPPMTEVVLIDSRELYVEVHRRIDDERWLTDLLRMPAARLQLSSVGLDLPLSILYSGVALDES